MNQRLQQRLGPEFMKRFNRVHFIGIGGSGMCGIAEVMLSLGYQVSGSDRSDSSVIERLRQLGASIHLSHAAEHVDDADVVVVSTAIAVDNVEVVAARSRRIPVVQRAEMLAELMRLREGIAIAGTHGKTTTTSLIASILAEAGLDPTFVVGGLLNRVGSNARLGEGRYLVAEADESDRSFLLLQPMIAVITNIDQDHLETYAHDPQQLRAAFAEFLQRLPFYGLAVVCVDDPQVRELAETASRSVIRYGFSDDADFRATDLVQHEGTVTFSIHIPGQAVCQVSLNMPGRHNVLNALAAIAVAWEVGVRMADIRQALSEFEGVGRRFNVHGRMTINGVQALFVDDYGHHPTELEATLDAAREGWPDQRRVVIFQPHRYSRTRDLMDEFARVLSSVDVLILAEVYSAGEAPIPGADSHALAAAIRARGQVEPICVRDPLDCREILPNVIEDGDLVMLLGAGDIGFAATRLYREGFDS